MTRSQNMVRHRTAAVDGHEVFYREAETHVVEIAAEMRSFLGQAVAAQASRSRPR